MMSTQAKSAGPVLLKRKVKLHYNWKFTFIRPTIKEVIQRDKFKFHGITAAMAAAVEAAVAASAARETAAASASSSTTP